MKKTMIIALLAVLVMGVFIACDGDVNAELAGGKRVITLEILNYDWYFTETGNKTMELEIPADCKTWADLEAKGSVINVTQQEEDSSELRLTHFTDYSDQNQKVYAHYYHDYGSYAIRALFHPEVKAFAPTLISSDIDSDNYEVYIYNVSSS